MVNGTLVLSAMNLQDLPCELFENSSSVNAESFHDAIKTIDLSKNKLTFLPADKLGVFPNLAEIIVSDNMLSEGALPASVAEV